MLHHLLNGRLKGTGKHYYLYLSQRGNNSRHHFEEAVTNALTADKAETNGSIQYNLEIVLSREMPELSIIDYLIWAVQRDLLHGESRYFDAMKSKYETVIHLYGEEEQ